MKRKITFVLAVFGATLLAMAVQKPVFLAWYAAEAAGAGFGGWCAVIWHGLSLDATVAGYVTALPLLLTLLSCWVRFPERLWRRVMTGYFVLVALLTAVVFAVDVALYEHWGFRLDSTILIYLADPKEAMASVDWALGVRQTLLGGVYTAAMVWLYGRVLRLFDGEPCGARRALPATLLFLLLAGGDFLAIRGGTGASVANVSKVYFSSEMFLNHAATNPVFSFLSSLGDNADYAAAYPFFDERTRAVRFDALRGNGRNAEPAVRVLDTLRPNVVVVILESFARTLPSVARSLGREGYATSFAYGGDLNFTNQAQYMYATGWQELVWQKDLRFDMPPADWGYDDALMCDWFADRVIALDAAGRPFLAGLLTLSSHKPFDVPYAKFENEVLNAMAFSDACVGAMIDRLKASPAWRNLLVVLVADHGYPYPKTLPYNVPLRHRIPMIWTGGAVAAPRVVEEYASQIDLAATLLGQLGIGHDDFEYSKDIFAPAPPRKFAYYTFNDGFGVVDATGEAIWDATGDRVVSATNPELLDVGRTMLQTTYTDLAGR